MASDFSRALVVLAEALVSEKRVVVVGDSSDGLHELLSELGARMVHVFDPDGERALAQPPPSERGTVLRGLPHGDFEVRDGAFDLAIVPEVTAIPDAAALLARLRRVVGTEGAVICAARNPDAASDDSAGPVIGYYELYDMVSLQFEHVRMIAAMPFVGMTLAELGQDEVDAAVRVDTQLAGDRPAPSAFVALASQHDVALDAYTVLELPPTRDFGLRVPVPPETSAELAQARLRADYLESQVEELASMRAARARLEDEARRALDALEVERQRVVRLERDLDVASAARIKQPAQADPVDHELAEQLAQAQLRAAALEEGVELAEKTIIVQRERLAEVEAALAERDERGAAPDQDQEEVATLEAKLKERGEVVASLEAELARREKLVKELVARLESTESPSPDEDLARKLDELALLAARQKSELEARAWRITELERGLTGTESPTHDDEPARAQG